MGTTPPPEPAEPWCATEAGGCLYEPTCEGCDAPAGDGDLLVMTAWGLFHAACAMLTSEERLDDD